MASTLPTESFPTPQLAFCVLLCNMNKPTRHVRWMNEFPSYLMKLSLSRYQNRGLVSKYLIKTNRSTMALNHTHWRCSFIPSRNSTVGRRLTIQPSRQQLNKSWNLEWESSVGLVSRNEGPFSFAAIWLVLTYLLFCHRQVWHVTNRNVPEKDHRELWPLPGTGVQPSRRICLN